jgi:hypothetical protein
MLLSAALFGGFNRVKIGSFEAEKTNHENTKS